MRHGAHRRHAEIAVGDGAGGGAAAADVGRARAQNGRVIALGAAGTELHNQAVASSAHHAVGFGGYQRLVVDGQQHHRLHQLRLNDRAADGNNRLVGEDRGALLHRPDVALEVEVCKVIQKLLVKNLLGTKVCDVLLGEAQVLQIVHQLLQACKDGKAAPVGDVAEKHIKDRHSVLHPVEEVAVRHGEFVVVGQHCQVSFFCPVDLHGFPTFLSFVIFSGQARPLPFSQGFACARFFFPQCASVCGEPLSKEGSPFGSYGTPLCEQ